MAEDGVMEKKKGEKALKRRQNYIVNTQTITMLLLMTAKDSRTETMRAAEWKLAEAEEILP